MFHKQSMDILLTARNVSRTRAFNYAFCVHARQQDGCRYGDYEGEDGGSRVSINIPQSVQGDSRCKRALYLLHM